MKAQNADENILVVGATSNCFNKVDVHVFFALTAGVVRVAPHDDVTDLVQDAMGNFKFPASLLTHICREGYS